MKQLIFNNQPNKEYKTEDGIIWHSRSGAVVCHIVLSINNAKYILLGKRGSKGDHPGKWNIPCGYLDWNETMHEAFYREVWEETGLNLVQLSKEGQLIIDQTEEPWKTVTDPSENRQNIALHGFLMYNVSSLPTLTIQNAEPGEMEEVKWFKLEEALELKKEEWAFNHYDRYRQLINHYNLF